MKTKELGHVLGISGQRNWWNSQTNRRITEERAVRQIGSGGRKTKSSTGGKRVSRPRRKSKSKNAKNSMRQIGVVTSVIWNTHLSILPQLGKYTAVWHKLEMSHGTDKLARIEMQRSPTSEHSIENLNQVFYIPLRLARLTKLAVGQNIKVSLRNVKLRSGRRITICRSLRFTNPS